MTTYVLEELLAEIPLGMTDTSINGFINHLNGNRYEET